VWSDFLPGTNVDRFNVSVEDDGLEAARRSDSNSSWFIREAGRLGAQGFERFASVIDPLRKRAVDFLQSGMDAGDIREQDPALLLFLLYTAVVGSLTEASVLNAVVGRDRSRASLGRRAGEVIAFVRSPLQPALRNSTSSAR
jgi:hypothetical protein